MFQNFDLMSAITRIPGILIGFTFHEFAHAFMAAKFGDPTPERDGRLSLNPFAHIDIWGLLLFIFAGFGWAKPVMTNPSYYRGNVRKKDMLVSLAGPVTNLIITIITTAIYMVLIKRGVFNGTDQLTVIVSNIIIGIISMNCVMFIFNLVPLPPLDGYHILRDLLPGLPYNFLMTVERYGFIILFVFIVSPACDFVVGNGASAVMNSIVGVMRAILRWG